jgi:hypothetical protein
MKSYPLELQDFVESESGNHQTGFWSKGHHDKAEFFEAVVEELAYRKNVVRVDEQYVRHVWWRFVPFGPGSKAVVFVKAKPGVRGAFPATILEF